MNTENLKEKIRKVLKSGRLKYNYFSCYHPKEELQCKSFKFINDNQIQFLKTKKKMKIDKKDLYSKGKKLYYPADGA